MLGYEKHFMRKKNMKCSVSENILNARQSIAGTVDDIRRSAGNDACFFNSGESTNISSDSLKRALHNSVIAQK